MAVLESAHFAADERGERLDASGRPTSLRLQHSHDPGDVCLGIGADPAIPVQNVVEMLRETVASADDPRVAPPSQTEPVHDHEEPRVSPVPAAEPAELPETEKLDAEGVPELPPASGDRCGLS
jgi:hypothetical protein